MLRRPASLIWLLPADKLIKFIKPKVQRFHDLCNFTLRIYQVFDNSSGKKPKMSETFDMPHLWWERDDLGYRNYRLFSGQQDLQVLAESSGTPAYADKQKITLAGNINEAIDVLAEDIELPAISEGDYLALLNTGGYGSASSSNHCMRGRFSEYLLID